METIILGSKQKETAKSAEIGCVVLLVFFKLRKSVHSLLHMHNFIN